MRLAINDWPPLVTHFLCLFLGALLANWQAPAEKELRPYQRQKASIALNASLLATNSIWPDESELLAVSLVLLDRSSHEPSCRLPPDFMSLLQRRPFPVVEVPTHDLGRLAKHLPPLGKAPLRLLPLANAASLAPCAGEPKVSYGQL